MPRTLKLTLAYDGTDYVGWQRQPNGPSVQAQLEQTLGRIEGRPVRVIGAGRTDAGVHALGQVASVTLDHGLDVMTLARALNATLPDDIRVIEVVDAAADFDARSNAHSKLYRYRIITGPWVSPFERRHVWHVPQVLDCAAMREGGALLCGEHDFAAFQAVAGSVKTSIRRIDRIDIDVRRPRESTAVGRSVTIEVEGNGFLRHMVRIIVGTLIEIGNGRRAVDDVARAIASGGRTNAGPTAPARGLFLVQVSY